MRNITKREAIAFEEVANNFDRPVSTETLDNFKLKVIQVETIDILDGYANREYDYYTRTCKIYELMQRAAL